MYEFECKVNAFTHLSYKVSSFFFELKICTNLYNSKLKKQINNHMQNSICDESQGMSCIIIGMTLLLQLMVAEIHKAFLLISDETV